VVGRRPVQLSPFAGRSVDGTEGELLRAETLSCQVRTAANTEGSAAVAA
jgi:hypothetical protein